MNHRYWQYKMIAARLFSGEVIAYPTEGVWGLGCLPESEQATMKILELKNRTWDKGLILLGSEFSQLEPYINLSGDEARTLEKSAGEGITYLVGKSDKVPLWISGSHQQVAVRISNHKTVKGICEAVEQPIVSTSANLSGKPAAKTRLQVIRYFKHQVDYIVPGAIGGGQGASKIVDLKTGTLIRPGGT